MNADETYLTKEGLEKLNKELDYLVNTKRKEVVERIQVAKSYGDLSENSEYESAKSEQSFIEGRIEEIKDVLKKAKIIKKTNGTAVGLGSKVIVEIDGEEAEYEIVGSSEADPGHMKVSNESPIGQAILGKKVGEEIKVETPSGDEILYKIKKVF